MTLFGLLLSTPISYHLPSDEKISDYVNHSYNLLEDLHSAVISKNPDAILGRATPPTKMFQEPIFYAADSAYYFQYLDFVIPKYNADSNWLLTKKNVDVSSGKSICLKIAKLHQQRMEHLIDIRLGNSNPSYEVILEVFQYSHKDLNATPAEIDFLNAFTIPDGETNSEFKSLLDYNVANAYPIIRKNDDEIIVPSFYCLTQSFYESPFYWLQEDNEYCQIAASNRGKATESIAVKLLERVFPKDNVFKNVKISGKKGIEIGEIDVLVNYFGHLIILQSKSKRLTLEARKGNVRAILNDFQKAIQEAVEQAFRCAEAISSNNLTYSCADSGMNLQIDPNSIIFPVILLLDHYPSLLHQTFLLGEKSNEKISSSFVTDIFVGDVRKLVDVQIYRNRLLVS